MVDVMLMQSLMRAVPDKAALLIVAETLLEVPERVRTALDFELQEGTVIADRVGETPTRSVARPTATPSRGRSTATAGRRWQAA